MFEEYSSRPKTVDAVRFTHENKDRVFNSLTGQYAADFENGQPILKVTTIHGDVAIVRIGDWIVKESELGRYYPVKNEAFNSSYKLNNRCNDDGFSVCPMLPRVGV